MNRIALVTGGNRGIGKEICRQLAEKNYTVILTSRSEEKGMKAVEYLKSADFDLHFHQLNVTNENSLVDAVKFLSQKFGHLDVLINNAGVFLDKGTDPENLDPDVLTKTLDVNTTGVLKAIQHFLPLLRKSDNPSVVNMSSGMGTFSKMSGNSIAYRTSKAALNAMTVVFADRFKEDGIRVNAMSPGWVRTDMGGEGANRSVAEGADTAVWLAEQPADGPTGKFFRDRTESEW
jgi:NAD(P)-dependent dehydrogenase (short-subunit alcohol dehydrogenase family)